MARHTENSTMNIAPVVNFSWNDFRNIIQNYFILNLQLPTVDRLDYSEDVQDFLSCFIL